jgi:hypothetical protein
MAGNIHEDPRYLPSKSYVAMPREMFDRIFSFVEVAAKTGSVPSITDAIELAMTLRQKFYGHGGKDPVFEGKLEAKSEQAYQQHVQPTLK